jgi:hypothetical protein
MEPQAVGAPPPLSFHGYSRFCDHYCDWRAGSSPTMRQTHVVGEALLFDFGYEIRRSSYRMRKPHAAR